MPEEVTLLDAYNRPIEKRLTYKDSVTLWQRVFGDGGGELSSAGEYVGQQEAMTVMTWFACVRNISEDIAKLPIKVRRPVEPRGSTEIREHPLARVCRYPNDEMDAFAFWQTIMGHALTTKGGMAEIARDGGGQISAFYLLDPAMITVMRNRNGQIAYQHRGMEENRALRANSVLHIHGLGYDGISGYNLTALAAQMLGAAIAMQKYRGSFFGNGANPSGVLKHPASLDENAQERLRRQFADRYTGGRNSNSVMLLEQGMDWQPVSTDPDKSQMVEGYSLNVTEVCRAFRMPPHKVGHNEGVSYATAEQGNQEYHTDTLTPWTRRIKSQLEFKCLSETERDAGIYVDIVLNALMRADTATRVNYMKDLYYMGGMSVNDILELEDRDLVDDGDRRFIQRNLVPYDRLDEVVDKEVAAGKEPPGTGDDQPNPGMTDEPPARAVIRMILEERVQRVLDIEIERIKRAKDMESFYDRFVQTAQSQLLSVFQAACVAFPDAGNPKSLTEAYSLEHCAASKRDVLDGDISGWSNGTRAKHAADAILKELEPCNIAA